MARERSTPEQLARRHRAFEIFCSMDTKGLKPSLKAIAHDCGVTYSAVKYWYSHDSWAAKVAKRNEQILQGSTEQQQSLKLLLRAGAYDAVATLHHLVKSGPGDVRIKAAISLVKLAKDHGAIDLESLPDKPAPLGFTDDLPSKSVALKPPNAQDSGPWASKTSLDLLAMSEDQLATFLQTQRPSPLDSWTSPEPGSEPLETLPGESEPE